MKKPTMFDDPTNVDDYYFTDLEKARAWLGTLTDAQLEVAHVVTRRCRFLPAADWAEGQTDTVYAIIDGEGDNRMFARIQTARAKDAARKRPVPCERCGKRRVSVRRYSGVPGDGPLCGECEAEFNGQPG